MKHPITALFVCFLFFSALQNTIAFGQFKTEDDDILKLRTITFRDERWPVQIPMVIKKTYSIDPGNRFDTTYEIGIYAISTIPNDQFMKSGGYIVFDDGSNIVFWESTEINFLHVGALYQISIRHKLSEQELKILQVKTISKITVTDFSTKLGKYEKAEVRRYFLDIEKR